MLVFFSTSGHSWRCCKCIVMCSIDISVTCYSCHVVQPTCREKYKTWNYIIERTPANLYDYMSIIVQIFGVHYELGTFKKCISFIINTFCVFHVLVILNCSRRLSLLAVCGGLLLETWVAQALKTLQVCSQDYLSML